MGYIGNQPVPEATQTRDSFTATSAQTTFTTSEGYSVGFVDVFMNGVRLNASDFTATDGSTVVLASGAATGDLLDIIAYETFKPSTAAGVASANTFTADQTISGELTVDSYNESYNAVTSSSNATTVDCETGNVFSHTLTENTTFTFSNPPASGTAFAFSLRIVQDSSASGYTVTWPSSVDWASATAPTLTATASAVDWLVFSTVDGGTTWYGFVSGQALA